MASGIERILPSYRFGNRYFENLNPEEEIPGKFSVETAIVVLTQAVQVVTAGSTSPRFVRRDIRDSIAVH